MDPTLFRDRRAALIDDDVRGPAFGRAYAALVDEWIPHLLGDEPRVAVIAGGAYGRRELAPGSDLDLVLVHDSRRDIRTIADRLWYPIWDARIVLDHGVRTPREAIALADEELKTVLSLLDGRPVAGDHEFAEGVLERIRDRWSRTGRRRLSGLEAITTERHQKEGDVAHLLEPDLKQGKGGLRDLRVLHALELASPVWNAANTGIEDAGATLLTVRIELHRESGRALDKLRLEDQDRVAARLGYSDADELMADVAGAGRTISRVDDDAWRRVRSWLSGPKGRSSGGRDRPAGPGLIVRDDELDLSGDADLSDPSLLLRAAEQSARMGIPLRRPAIERLAASAAPPGDPWPEEARQALVGLLGTGENLIPVFETLDHYGLVTRFLPEWEQVRSRPQRNAFHRYTVDRHLTEAVARAAAFTRDVGRPDLLLVGAWLHDLGKGWPGDHTDAGVTLVRAIATRMGFAPEDVETLVTMVRHHLLLPSIATSRDLNDPATITAVAEAVGTEEHLHLLAALTEADSLATGPSAWSTWKAELVGTLVQHVERALAGEELAVAPRALTPDQAALVERAAGGLRVEADERRFRLVGPDHPGLLCNVVGLLAVYGCNVRAAHVFGSDGIAVEELDVEPAFEGREIDWAGFQADLDDTLAGRYPLSARVADRSRTYARQPTAARPAEPRVLVHEAASEAATVLEVRASDSVGLLYRITRVIADLGLDIWQAKVSTLGHEVVDTFYLRTVAGTKPDPGLTARCCEALLAELDG